MAPPPKDLGPDCEIGEGPQKGYVACRICTVAAGKDKWMKRHSWTKHISYPGHQSALLSRSSAVPSPIHNGTMSQVLLTTENYNRAYETPAIQLSQSVPPVTVSNFPSITSTSEVDEQFLHLSEPGFTFSDNEREMLFPALHDTAFLQQQNEAALKREFEQLKMQALEEELEGQAEDASVPSLVHEIRALGLNEEYDEDEIHSILTGLPNQSDFSPYTNKTTFLLDVLDNLPRLRLSSSHMKMILWVMRNCNPRDVPSFKGLRQEQERLRKACGVRSIQYKSQGGDIYYLNDVVDIIKKNFENPETAPYILLYPEDVDDHSLSEFSQFSRVREHPDQLTPSFRKGNKRFYVNELALLDDGRFVIPTMWVMYHGHVHAYCKEVREGTEGFVVVEREVRIPANNLEMNYPDLVQLCGARPVFAEPFVTYSSAMPNRFRELDEDEDHFTVWMPVWADDVSGARSKQYQKHVNVYMCNGSLPGKLVQQEFHVHFVGTSPHVSAPEMLGSVMAQVESTHEKPARCHNAATGRPCRFRIQVPYLPADNPQQSEECSHIGHHGSYPCRICHVGGPYTVKESDDGYHAMYNVGTPRSANETRESLRNQLTLASRGVASHVEAAQTESGVTDKITQQWINKLLERAKALKKDKPHRDREEISRELLDWLDKQTKQPYNPLLDAKYLDPSQDTPIENLHTYLLGHEKYTWYDLHTSWKEPVQNLFTIRLQSTNIDGLGVPPIRAAYMMQYRNGLIGKHFKTLMQTAVFHVQDIVTENQFTLIKAIGELGALLWVAEIDDLEQYLEDLETLIDNVLDSFALIDPAKILVKIKLHLLKHIPCHIRRFGPAVRFSTEVFECFNAVFRMSSVLSNHQAPSRDIALKNGEMTRVKHLLCGGFWMQSGRLQSAGRDVVALLKRNPIVQQHLGWTPPHGPKPGTVRVPGREKQTILSGEKTSAFEAKGNEQFRLSDCEWILGTHVIACSGDLCGVGSWVVVRSRDYCFVGQISEILQCEEPGRKNLITVAEFTLAEALHHYYQMPVLHQPKDRHVVLPECIDFIINVQHDCRAAGCSNTGTIFQRQEREESDRIISTIEHVDDQRYIVNMHALHNAARLRKYLPRYMTVPRPLYPDRRKRHDELATALRVTEAEKRVKRKEKAAATRAENAKKASGRAANDQDSSGTSGSKRRRVDADDGSDERQLQ
ncbi:hypothetical protein VKT23_006832 [Stygiomarasmius scandens]|uniref:Uncharacterized protein n=1 Tax=Marasmiellus scandens TaxID=2682957 RepID=A0ABR1JN46_9AGAR